MKKELKTFKKTAEKFQELTRKKKALEADLQPLRDALIGAVAANRDILDSSFSFVFENGVSVQLRTTEVLEGNAEERRNLTARLLNTEYVSPAIDARRLISEAKVDSKLQKSITAAGCSVVQKESWAISAK